MSRTELGVYRCNGCKANLSAKETTHDHLSLQIGPKSGVAYDDGPLTGFRIYHQLPQTVVHFCLDEDGRSECLSNWIAVQTRDPKVGDAV